MAIGLDLRVPTGNEMNLLGTGAPGLQPFAIFSATNQKISLHGNAGYQWNGASVIAGNPATGTSADFPDQVTYAVGADVSAHPRLTLAFDVLGRRVIDAERLSADEFHALDGKSVYPSIAFSRQSFNGAQRRRRCEGQPAGSAAARCQPAPRPRRSTASATK